MLAKNSSANTVKRVGQGLKIFKNLKTTRRYYSDNSCTMLLFREIIGRNTGYTVTFFFF